eukprot:458622-Prorocentrum_minimum.AAC.1
MAARESRAMRLTTNSPRCLRCSEVTWLLLCHDPAEAPYRPLTSSYYYVTADERAVWELNTTSFKRFANFTFE